MQIMSQSGSGDTGTVSIEVSVPTDLTVTSEGDSEEHREDNMRRQTRDIQMHRLIEKLKLELQEKEAQLTSSTAQFASLLHQKNLENDFKLSDKQAKINRLEAELMTTGDELRLLKERAAKELAHLLQKCFQFQQNQNRLSVKHEEIKSSLADLILSDDQFYRIKDVPRDQMNLQQYASLRVYELVMPLKVKLKELETIKSSLENTVSTYEKELGNRNRDTAKLSQESRDLRERLVEYSSRLEEMRNEMKTDDFRIHNFDRIKRERDKYEEEKEYLLRERSEVELSSSVFKREKQVLEERISDLKSKFRIQEQELSKYKNDYHEIKKQVDQYKDAASKAASQIKVERDRSEDIHEKFLKAKTDIISLTDTLQDVQSKLSSLQEDYFNSLQSEARYNQELQDLQNRFSKLTEDYETLQSNCTKERDSLRLEVTEVRANYNTVSKTYNDILDCNIKLMKDARLAQTTLQEEKFKSGEEIMKLKQDCLCLRKELNQYRDLENDYLSSLRAFASVGVEVHDRGTYSTRMGQIPVSSIVQGKLSEETISLTRRILNLERDNAEACSVIHSFTSTLDQMRASLSSYKTSLSMAGKPTSDLLHKIKTQEEQIILLDEALDACNEAKISNERTIQKLKEDLKVVNSFIKESRNHKDEIVKLKKEITDLTNWIVRYENKPKYRPPIPSAITITKGK